MMAGCVIDGDGFEYLKKSRIGETKRKERIEDGDWPASEIV
jgi:hypothetical protein